MPPKLRHFLQNLALLVFSLVMIEILLRLAGAGYNYLYLQQPVHEKKPGSVQKVIMCIGESTTAWGAETSYPSRLQKKLDTLFGTGKYLVLNEGVAATNTSAIVAGIEDKIKKHNPDIIITMMGINDVWALNNELSFWDDFQIYKFLKLANANLPVLWQEWAGEKKSTVVTPPAPSSYSAARPVENRSVKFLNLIQQAKQAFDSGHFREAKAIILRASNVEPLDSQSYALLARSELESGNISASVTAFERYVKILDSYDAAHEAGVAYFFKTGATTKPTRLAARKFLKLALTYNPNGLQANKYLGFTHLIPEDQNDDIALEYLEKAYSQGLREFDLIFAMSNLYIRKNENTKAENILISGLNQPGDVIWVWAELIKFYINTHHPEKAEEYLVKAEKKFPHNPMLTDLKVEYLKSRNLPFADIKIYSVKNFFDYPITQRNYLAYADILKRYPLKNVIMQYPLRETGPLKKLLSGYEGIVFVDNSIVFTEALKIHTYDELFLDRFGEDFGHFTQISSDMIADNIILTLKKENFLPH